MRFNKKILSRSKWTQLLQLNKQLKISLLDITRKKIKVYFSIVLGSLQKTGILLSDSVVIFCIKQYFFIFYYPLFLIIRKISVMFTFILTLHFFFLFWKILISLATIFSFLAFSSSERFWYLFMSLFEAVLCFSNFVRFFIHFNI